MSPRILLGLVFILTGIGAGAGRARADGVHVERRIDLGELARTSDVVFVATIRDSRHEWAEREAYGQKHRYVQHYKFQVEPTAWLKGGPEKGKGALWLGLRGDPVPGKWEILHEDYDVTFNPSAAKKGDQVVVFATRDNWQNWTESAEDVPILYVRACEKAERLGMVRKALRARRNNGPPPR